MFAFAVAVDLEGAARLDAGQHTHQTLRDTIFDGDAAGDVLLTGLGRCQVADRSPVATASASDAAFSRWLTCSTVRRSA